MARERKRLSKEDVAQKETSLQKSPTQTRAAQATNLTLQKSADRITELERTLSERERAIESLEGDNSALLSEISELREKLSTIKNSGDATDDTLNELSAQLGKIGIEKMVYLDPSRIKPFKFADRDSGFVQTEEFVELREKIRQMGGNHTPITVRPLSNDPDYDFEVVYGHRRRLGCELENFEVLSLVAHLSDREAAKRQFSENNDRTNLDTFEKSDSLSHYLSGVFNGNQSEMAEEFNVTEGHISQYLALQSYPRWLREYLIIKNPSPRNPDAIIKDVAGIKVLRENLTKFISGKNENELEALKTYLSQSQEEYFSLNSWKKRIEHITNFFQEKTKASPIKKEVDVKLKFGKSSVGSISYGRDQPFVLKLTKRMVSMEKMEEIHKAVEKILEKSDG